METIIDLDEQENDLLQKKISLITGNKTSKIQLGVWVINCPDITWSNYEYLALLFGCVEAVKPKQVYVPVLLDVLLDSCRKKYKTEDGLFIWKAQQSYRIILAFFSEEEQLEIFYRVQKAKNRKVTPLTTH